MIVRGPRQERDFTILPNAALRASSLSWKARGLLGFLLSQPPGYRVTSERLAEESPDGRDAVRSGLRELEEHRYLVRSQRRDEQGRWVSEAVVYEEPVALSGAGKPVPGVTSTNTAKAQVRPETENPAPDSPALEEVLTPEVLEELPPPVTPPTLQLLDAREASADGSFDAFWTVFPQKRGKGAARRAWAKAKTKAPTRVIIGAAQRYAQDPNRDPAYTCLPATWLNQERWEDDPLPPRNGAHRDDAAIMDWVRREEARQAGRA